MADNITKKAISFYVHLMEIHNTTYKTVLPKKKKILIKILDPITNMEKCKRKRSFLNDTSMVKTLNLGLWKL